jgi:hypothetical protein
MIGPIVKVDPAQLPRAANIHYLGARPYEQLPAYASGFSVCLMPFAMNEASAFINPTKTLEYLATGKPVVSTPVRDVVRLFSEVVAVADRDGFPAAVESVLASGGRNPARAVEVAKSNSWERIVGEMELLLARIVQQRNAERRMESQSWSRPLPVPRPRGGRPRPAPEGRRETDPHHRRRADRVGRRVPASRARLHRLPGPRGLERPGRTRVERDEQNGFVYDIGGHVLFSHFRYFDELFDRMLGRTSRSSSARRGSG